MQCSERSSWWESADPAGPDGLYAAESVFGRCPARLAEMAEQLRHFRVWVRGITISPFGLSERFVSGSVVVSWSMKTEW